MKFSNILMIGASVAVLKASAACWSESLGYKCCKKDNTKVYYKDKDGKWGVEHGEWCGIEETSSDAACWSLALGYPCCSGENVSVKYTDDDGEWGIEKKKWCGIVKSQDQDTPQYGDDMKTYATQYMAKLKIEDFCPANISERRSGVTYGNITKRTYPSTTTKGDRQCNVVLPINYSPDKKYPVLYLLHGIFGSEDSMLKEKYGTAVISGNMVLDGLAKEMIIVTANQYAPKDGIEVEEDYTQEYFDGYDNFINDLVNDLMPFMKENYPILEGRENTAVAGFSMGGRNALYIGFQRPDLFGYIGAFSPAPGVTPGQDMNAMHKGLFTEDEFRIKDQKNYTPFVTLISCGTDDPAVTDVPKTYHEILTRNDQPHVWYEIPNTGHDGIASSSGYYNLLSSLFGNLNN